MPFGITVGVLTIVFLIAMEAMLAQRKLMPGVVMLGAFIMFVLYLTGMIETAIQMFGPASNINGNCKKFIDGNPSRGVSIGTFAWLEQHMICQAWQAVFAFWIVGAVFLVWLFVLAGQVNKRLYD